MHFLASDPNATSRPCGKKAEPWVLAATILASSMAFIDGSVINVALPALQEHLGASMMDAQWVIESYALTLAALLLPGGALGDRFGRRRIFSFGVALFALASIACGLSSNVYALISWRAVQGIGAAMLVPGSLAILSASFPPAERGRAIGTWSAFTAITTAGGPVLGGWLIQHASWRWIFFLNIPLAAAVLVLTVWHIPESRNPAAGRIDYAGTALIASGLGSLSFGLTESSRFGFGSPLVLGTLLLGVLLSLAFVVFESRTPQPMLPPRLFRNRGFLAANLLTLLLYGALGGLFLLFPLNLIQIQGYSTTAAGGASLPLILIIFLLSRTAGGLVARFGSRLPLVIGAVTAAVGFALFALPGIGGSYWTTFFPALMVLGLGMAIAVAPLTTTVMNSVDESQVGVASGVNNAVSRTAGLLAIALFGAVALVAFSSGLHRRTASLPLTPELRTQMRHDEANLGAMHVPPQLAPATALQMRTDIDQSFLSAFRISALLAASLTGLGALVTWSLLGRTDSPTR